MSSAGNVKNSVLRQRTPEQGVYFAGLLEKNTLASVVGNLRGDSKNVLNPSGIGVGFRLCNDIAQRS